MLSNPFEVEVVIVITSLGRIHLLQQRKLRPILRAGSRFCACLNSSKQFPVVKKRALIA